VIYMMFAAGFGSFLAALQVMLRDVEHGLTSFLLFMFYATPILYPRTLVPQPLRDWLWVISLRAAVRAPARKPVAGRWVQASDLGLALAGLVVLACGVVFFQRLAPHFEDFL
jgi:lipopolysaccharide transport system permease protein